MLDVYTMLIITLIVLGLNIVFFLINIFILGYCLAKIMTIPTPKQIIKEIMDTKVPVMANPNQLPPNIIPPIDEDVKPPISRGKDGYFG